MSTKERKPTPFRRDLTDEQLTTLSRLYTDYFQQDVSTKRVQQVADLICDIEEKMIGRIAGDIDDYIFNYLLNFYTAQTHKNQPDIVHVEIGTLFGGSLILAAKAIEEAGCDTGLIAIDPLDGYYFLDEKVGSELDWQTKLPINLETVEKNIEMFQLDQDRVQIWRNYSNDATALAKIKNEKIGLLFIDGDHSYDGVLNDWKYFSQQVVDGGKVLIDNFLDRNWPDVSRFAADMIPQETDWSVDLVINRSLVMTHNPPNRDAKVYSSMISGIANNYALEVKKVKDHETYLSKRISDNMRHKTKMKEDILVLESRINQLNIEKKILIESKVQLGNEIKALENETAWDKVKSAISKLFAKLIGLEGQRVKSNG